MTLISLDLPTNGYASMIEHTDIAEDRRLPLEQRLPDPRLHRDFVVAVVDELEALQPGFKDKIVGVIGGSLGGNMGIATRAAGSHYPSLAAQRGQLVARIHLALLGTRQASVSRGMGGSTTW